MIEMKLDDKKLQKAMRNITKKIKNPKRLLRQVGAREVTKAKDRVLHTKFNPDNKKWAPWSYLTLQQRIREGNAGKGLLYRTGSLLSSFAFKVRRMSVEIFTNKPYAKYLQFGTPKMPKREILGWGKDSLKTLPIATKKMITKLWK